jgi:VIT1/CCC1 family predicted Fe2+/Mn2+ transporter
VNTKSVIRKNREEKHRSGRAGWLRAAVLGSDDAIVSTASLMIGVAASSASKEAILVAGVAALARPLQAAWISAASFASFAVIPIAALLVASEALRIPAIAAASLVSLAALGALGGHLGGAPLGRAALRVTLGGALAMAVTAGIGRILGVSLA